MKYTLVFFLSLASSVICHSQDLPGTIKNIKTAEQAWNFLDEHPKYKGEVIRFKEIQDSSAFAKKLYQIKKGAILSYGQYIYKVLWDTISPFSKVRYIYFNGDSLTIQQIDSLRGNIIEQYKSGTPFAQLASMYTMDGNTTGELDWFYQGNVVPEFNEAINQRAKGEVFTVNVPSHNWYFVVNKTHDTRLSKEVVVFKIKNK